MKKKTINVHPYHIESKNKYGQFTLTFYDFNKTVHVNLQRWWIPYIARELYKIIDAESAEISRLREGMKHETR